MGGAERTEQHLGGRSTNVCHTVHRFAVPANLHLDKARVVNRTQLWGGLLSEITQSSDNGNPDELEVERRLAIAPSDGIGEAKLPFYKCCYVIQSLHCDLKNLSCWN